MESSQQKRVIERKGEQESTSKGKVATMGFVSHHRRQTHHALHLHREKVMEFSFYIDLYVTAFASEMHSTM